MPNLFDPITLSGLTIKNRVWVSPMCQYSAIDGVVGDWHMAHLGAFATGEAGLVMAEATGVVPEGRISIACPGIYNEKQVEALAAYVASLAPGPEVPGESHLNYERDGSIAEGGELFRTNCAMCHNFAGQGGALSQGKYAPTIMGVEPKHIYEAMVTGPQSMPVFSDKTITPEEKLSVIKWIKAAEAEPNLGGATMGRIGPVSEGLLAWVLGLGLLIGIAVWLTTRAR